MVYLGERSESWPTPVKVWERRAFWRLTCVMTVCPGRIPKILTNWEGIVTPKLFPVLMTFWRIYSGYQIFFVADNYKTAMCENAKQKGVAAGSAELEFVLGHGGVIDGLAAKSLFGPNYVTQL